MPSHLHKLLLQSFEVIKLLIYIFIMDMNRCNLNILMSDQLCLQWWLDYILTVS